MVVYFQNFNKIIFAMLNTWEDKLHDKMTSAYSKSCGYKKFSVHTNTKKYRFQIVPLWRAFSKSSVFVDLFTRISVDGSRIRNNKVAYSNLSGIVWTGPQSITVRSKKRSDFVRMDSGWVEKILTFFFSLSFFCF